MECISISRYDECLTPKGWSYINITRPFSIIYYALGGSASVELDGSVTSFLKGHLYILPSSRVFSLMEDPKDKFYSVYVHAFTSPEIGSLVDIDLEKDDFAKRLADMLRRYIGERDALCLRITVSALLSYVSETVLKNEVSLPSRLRGYIDENCVSVFRGFELSSVFNYSRSYINKLFRQQFGVTPKQYAQRLVMEKSVALLLDGVSVAGVSERLCFSSPENFSRAFKAYYKHSPTHYVKEMRSFALL